MSWPAVLRGLILAAVMAGPAALLAEEPISSEANREIVPMPTLGGKQFWADELLFHQWRIQRNVLTGHYRLLDGNSLRHASGTFDECRAVLEDVKRRGNLPPMHGKAVIVLHGLAHSRTAMNELAKYLEEKGGYAVVNVGYPSTRGAIADHARSLGRVIENLDGVEEINFVAHSMGNIVIRCYLAQQTDPAGGRQPDRRIKRFVMLGPPNQGSEAATALADNELFKALLGQAGQELGREWVWLAGNLATPRCEFGIVAGGLGNEHGFNPLLPGDDDGVVTVESTRLEGAKDFVVVPVLHLPLIYSQRVQEYTLRFLQTGRFREP